MIPQNSILNIFAVLAVCMHVMVQLAPLWMPQDGNTIQICTTQGIQTITLDENGQQIPNNTPPAPKHGCPFCLAQTNVSTEAPYNNITLCPDLNYVKLMGWKDGIIISSGYKTPAHQSRAPPAFS